MGSKDPQRIEDGGVVDAFPRCRDLGLGRALPVRLIDDVVVDVGDVGDMVDVDPCPFEITPDDVVGHRLAGMAEMRMVVDGRATGVQRELAGVTRFERAHFASKSVVETDHDGSGFSCAGWQDGRVGHRRARRVRPTL